MFLQRTAICFGFVVPVFHLISLLVARLFGMDTRSSSEFRSLIHMAYPVRGTCNILKSESLPRMLFTPCFPLVKVYLVLAQGWFKQNCLSLIMIYSRVVLLSISEHLCGTCANTAFHECK